MACLYLSSIPFLDLVDSLIVLAAEVVAVVYLNEQVAVQAAARRGRNGAACGQALRARDASSEGARGQRAAGRGRVDGVSYKPNSYCHFGKSFPACFGARELWKIIPRHARREVVSES